MVYVMMIALNEQKFIQSSLKAVLKRKEVGGVVVVEGADRQYPRATSDGLSVDDTARIVGGLIEKDDRIVYHRYGWADGGKLELRQGCIDLVYHRYEPKPNDWGLFVDADEVWSDGNWAKLMSAIIEKPHVGSLYFQFLHFWKTPDQIAVGGQWDSKLFRLFRFAEPNLKLTGHAQEPICENGQKISEKYGRADTTGIYLHHYGYCKDQKDVQDKIHYYAKRDTHLDVKDTWTDWGKGKETQPTHGGGSVEGYYGLHPKEVQSIFRNTALYE